jgi:hypothetical protein
MLIAPFHQIAKMVMIAMFHGSIVTVQSEKLE